MNKTEQYFEGRKLVLTIYSLLFIFVSGALIDLMDFAGLNLPYINELSFPAHILLFMATLLLLVLLGFIVTSNLKKIEDQYRSLLTKEQNLCNSEANLRTILNNTNTAYYLIDTGFTIIDFNQLSEQLVLEETGKELKKQTSYRDYIEPDRQEYLCALYKRTLAGEEINTEIKTSLGKWYKVNMRRIISETGKILGLCIASTDVTEIKKVQQEIKDSEEMYRLIFYNGPSPKWIIDEKTLRCLEVNEQAILHYGYSREEFLDMTVYDMRKPDTHHELKELQAHGTYSDVKNKIVHHLKKNGESIVVQISLYPIHYKGQEVVMAMAHDVTELIRLQEQLSTEKINKQLEITKATICGQERERAELGKELHDNINQLLTSAKLYLDTSLIEEQRRIPLVQKGRDLVLTGINEIRKISSSLVPPSLGDLTLKEALKELVLPAKATGKNVYLNLDDLNEAVLTGELKIALYRIVQEAFNNTIKYANATQINISVTKNNDLLTLKIKDNGKGFDLNKKRNGIGITNMNNRTAILNGRLQIDSAPEKGCSVKAIFKIPSNGKI